MSICIFVAVILGVGAGIWLPDNIGLVLESASPYLLILMALSVGIEMGCNRKVFAQVRELGLRILLIPASIIVGTLAGGFLVALIVGTPTKDGLAIVSGLGWYSISGAYLTEAGNPVAGTISFLSNVFREIIAFIIVPFLATHLNGYCAIGAAAASSMDTVLGVISKNTNPKIAIIAFVNGVVCALCVPILIPLFI